MVLQEHRCSSKGYSQRGVKTGIHKRGIHKGGYSSRGYSQEKWVFIKGGCSGRRVQWMGVVLYNKLVYSII